MTYTNVTYIRHVIVILTIYMGSHLLQSTLFVAEYQCWMWVFLNVSVTVCAGGGGGGGGGGYKAAYKAWRTPKVGLGLG